MQVNEKNFPYITTPTNETITLQNQTKWLINTLQQKQNWEKVRLGEVCYEIDEKVEHLTDVKILVTPDCLKEGDFTLNEYQSSQSVLSGKKFTANNLLFTRRSVSVESFKKRASLTSLSGICTSEITVISNKECINLKYLVIVLNTTPFWNFAISTSVGSVSKRIKWHSMIQYHFHLPPLPIQQQIADLLWSIEHQITATQQTQTALQQLKKKLLHQLFNPSLTDNNNSPLFTLQKEDFKQVKFGEVVRHVKEKADYQTLKRFVAGEHMETDELQIKQWGEITEDTVLGSAFCTKFKAGQILYGSRRTYLRKVAIAHFEGVCANTTFILEPMDANILNRDYLAFMMQGEVFATYSINNSKGSTNPYINFTDLQPFEFNLPSIDKQIATAALFNHLEQCLQEAVALTEALQGLKKGLINSLM